MEELLLRLTADASEAVGSAAIRSLANIDVSSAANIAAKSKMEPERWVDIFTTFLQRRGGAEALVTAFKQNAASRDVAEVGLRLMNESGRFDRELADLLRPPELQKISMDDLSKLVDEVRKSGNSERGEQVYTRAELGCVACHAVKGIGGNIGPDLGALGTAQPISFIIGAILDPQREVKEGYASLTISTKNGDEYQGYALDEDATELRLRETLGNEVISVPKSEIQQRKQSGSLMPAGLVDQLSRQEFIDLVKYLSELGQ